MRAESLEWIIANCRTVLFDFDGPLCDVFANVPAPNVARELEQLADRSFDTDDPLEVLRLSFELDPDAGQRVEDALEHAEVSAVRVSEPERDGVSALRSFAADGRRVGIVSNNCQAAIETFLDRHDIRQSVSTVVGRARRRPDLMKPDPWALFQALSTSPRKSRPAFGR